MGMIIPKRMLNSLRLNPSKAFRLRPKKAGCHSSSHLLVDWITLRFDDIYIFYNCLK